ncbi:glycoside hydrolase family 68 protein [Leuconostoc carnosum]|uniref:glycoside hydrolase family 68 protein n=1 Tax=Leuconostoc carnosum TaxID=1252 RepID=UPI00167FF079|nr:glycoside hydrolase family 68 protein [Leuconostoc carnosum]
MSEDKTLIRKKLYKSGKGWVIGATVFAAMSLGASSVSADNNTIVPDKIANNNTVVPAKPADDNTVVPAKLADDNTVVPAKLADDNTVVPAKPADDNTVVPAKPADDNTVVPAKLADDNTVVPAKSADDNTVVPAKLADDNTVVPAKLADDNTVVPAKPADDNTVVPAKPADDNTVVPAKPAVLNENGLTDKAQTLALQAKIDISTLTTVQKQALNKIKLVNEDGDKYIIENNNDTITKETIINKNNVSDITTTTHISFANLDDAIQAAVKPNAKTTVPVFNASAIKNLKAATFKDAQTNKVETMDVWDSWALQDAKTGEVYNYHGKQVVFALMGAPLVQGDTHIYMLYNSYNSATMDGWLNMGPIFGYNAKAENQEWSGSAVVNSDDSIQLFYTRVADNWKQALSTVNITMNTSDNKLAINGIKNDHTLFEGDGYYYATTNQLKPTADMFTLRDPKLVELDNGERYLTFEANTGTYDDSSADQTVNLNNYGGGLSYDIARALAVVNDSSRALYSSTANGAIGLLKLNNINSDPSVEKLFKPLITAVGVTDEIERPNIVSMNGKYYLFTDSRFNRSAADKSPVSYAPDGAMMLGFVSDSIFGNYKPLNGNGLVLVTNNSFRSRTNTYSWYTVPVKGRPDLMLVTSYMTNRGLASGDDQYSTFAPSFLLQINGDSTHVLNTVTEQGDWVWGEDDHSKVELLANSPEQAYLSDSQKNINYYPDWSNMDGYSYPIVTNVTTVDLTMYISGRIKSDSIWKNAPERHQGARIVGTTSQHNAAKVMVTKQYVDDLNTTWYLATLSGEQFWIKSTSLVTVPINEDPDFHLYINFNENFSLYVNAPYGNPQAQYFDKSTNYAGQYINIGGQYTDNNGTNWKLISVANNIAWINSKALSKTITRSISTKLLINSTKRNDGMYLNNPYGQTGYKRNASTRSYNENIVTVSQQYYDDKGTIWNLISLDGKKLWVDSRAFATSITKDLNQKLFIDSRHRNDGMYLNAPYRASGAQRTASTRSYNGQLMTVTKQYKDVYGMTWNLINLNGQQVWVDNRAFTTAYRTKVNQNLYINSNTRTDGMYTTAPYRASGAKKATTSKSHNGQRVQVTEQYRDVYGVTWSLANVNGKKLWIDNRALTQTITTNVSRNVKINSKKRTDGIYTNAPYGDKNAKWLASTKKYNGKKLTATKEYKNAKGVTWYLVTLDNRRVWIDQRAFN